MNEVNEKRYEYQKKYHAENYYRMNIAIPKEMRSVIDEAAKAAGMSKNAFIKQAIEEKIARLG